MRIDENYTLFLTYACTLGPLALQKLSTLSGGQKSRVAFSMVGWGAPQLLVLDEPTNHLDVETVDVLGNVCIFSNFIYYLFLNFFYLL